jgi:hypothetical protein
MRRTRSSHASETGGACGVPAGGLEFDFVARAAVGPTPIPSRRPGLIFRRPPPSRERTEGSPCRTTTGGW